MRVQYALYKTRLIETGKEVEVYLTATGGASENHEEALLLTGKQIGDGEYNSEEFPFVCLDPAISTEAYFSENYNLFVKNREYTLKALVKQGIIPMQTAISLGMSEELATIFFTMLQEMLITYIKILGTSVSWDSECTESIPLTAFNKELRRIIELVYCIAPRIHLELLELGKRKASR